MQTLNDPYFTNKISEIDTSFLNFTPYANSTNPQILCFTGTAESLKKTISTMPQQQLTQYKSLRINIIGTQVKERDNCCLMWTIFLGVFLVVPLVLVRVGWWRRAVGPLWVVANQGYDALIQLLRKCQPIQLYLMIQDNFFNRSKAQVIIETLQTTTVRNFVFKNVAQGFDADGSNYTNFTQYMRPIKSTMIKSDVSWGNKLLLP